MNWKLLPAMIAVILLFAGYASGEVIDFNGLDWQVGPDENMNWNQAKAWVDGLGGNWRMPTLEELRGLWDAGVGRVEPYRWGPFENNGYSVWSVEVRDSSSAWFFGFNDGGERWGNRSYSSYLRAFAVRSPQDASETASVWTEMYGNDGGLNLSGEQVRYEGEVFEYTSHYWLVGPDRDMDWAEAKEWVDDLGGNWRMPYREELQGLWDAGISEENWGPFENSGLWVWSGEIRSSRDAWAFYFSSLGEESVDRSNSINGRAFAVRPLYDRHTFRRNRLPTLEP